ncbi:MAG TPA: type III secretion system export apparatus subunit SctS [Thermoanaerobaculia bacterium]|nr:type III secretion system export apparatus subunit SctS [Thermoanaerobaculia bacterium]
MEGDFIHIAQQAILVTVLVSAPPILAALVVGLALAVFQALTQIQEQTIQMAAKIVAVFGMLFLFGYWMASQVYRFALNIFENFGQWVG